jgi:hypothetical protein
MKRTNRKKPVPASAARRNGQRRPSFPATTATQPAGPGTKAVRAAPAAGARQVQRTQSTAEICGLFEVAPVTLHRWIKAGCPSSGSGKARRFNADELLEWKECHPELGHVGRTQTVDSEALLRAKLRKENALADQYEMAAAKQHGELVPAAEAKAALTAQVTAAKNKLLGLADAVSPSLEGLTAAMIREQLHARIVAILKELGGERKRA